MVYEEQMDMARNGEARDVRALTKLAVYLTCWTKMRVPFAKVIFSEPMLAALDKLINKEGSRLYGQRDASLVLEFCKAGNDIFSSLLSKKPVGVLNCPVQLSSLYVCVCVCVCCVCVCVCVCVQ